MRRDPSVLTKDDDHEILISTAIDSSGVFYFEKERLVVRYILDDEDKWFAYILNEEQNAWQSLWPPQKTKEEAREIALTRARGWVDESNSPVPSV